MQLFSSADVFPEFIFGMVSTINPFVVDTTEGDYEDFFPIATNGKDKVLKVLEKIGLEEPKKED